ncbi:hypothetical protein LR48_Vigan226s001700 [Vigna angularis]|uniref:Uncharacterized protein n=1 Tax=Phaseolus angularis TaxID=3914 RepID=A0A0L9T684_PHAAN|nr:hypothetical protein LR48_Vigan226s001700 [Vigna angularis]
MSPMVSVAPEPVWKCFYASGGREPRPISPRYCLHCTGLPAAPSLNHRRCTTPEPSSLHCPPHSTPTARVVKTVFRCHPTTASPSRLPAAAPSPPRPPRCCLAVVWSRQCCRRSSSSRFAPDPLQIHFISTTDPLQIHSRSTLDPLHNVTTAASPLLPCRRVVKTVLSSNYRHRRVVFLGSYCIAALSLMDEDDDGRRWSTVVFWVVRCEKDGGVWRRVVFGSVRKTAAS